jgi:hypothetical protein
MKSACQCLAPGAVGTSGTTGAAVDTRAAVDTGDAPKGGCR